jgi:hypothetical protein
MLVLILNLQDIDLLFSRNIYTSSLQDIDVILTLIIGVLFEIKLIRYFK